MRSNRRRLAGMLAGTILLSVAVVTAGTPVSATAQPGTTVAEFDPADYPVCSAGGTDRTVRYVVNRIVANSPEEFPTDPLDPLYVWRAQAAASLQVGLHALIQDDPSTARQRMTSAGYGACSGAIDSIGDRDLVLVYPFAGMSARYTEGEAMLVLYPGQLPNATVLSGPHLRNEAVVKNQILDALVSPSDYVKGAVLSGTHRCNRVEFAPPQYQGVTNACNGVYRVSDMAHNVETVFQRMHDVLRDEYPETFLLQLHGMEAPGISVSRGENPSSGITATHPDDPITRAHSYAEARLRADLEAGGLTAVEEEHYDNLTTCTRYLYSGGTEEAPWRNVHCGTKNAQLDRELDSNSADRFIHLEQSRYLRDHHASYIDSVMEGLASA